MKINFAKIAFTVGMLAFLALPVHAQSTGWKVDSDHSSANISVKSETPDESSLSLGAASASGILRVDRSNPENSSLQLDLYPAGAGDQVAFDDPGETTHLTFQSRKASVTPDGKLIFTGTLTVTSLVRQIQLEGNEAYSGPVETGRVVYEASHEISLTLPIPPATRHGRGGAYAEVSTSLTVSAEDFPELLDEVLATNWPAKGQNVTCESPASASEDYSGTMCTGTAVETRSVNRVASTVTEDYSGGDPLLAQPANFVTLALNLRLEQQGEQVSAKTGQ